MSDVPPDPSLTTVLQQAGAHLRKQEYEQALALFTRASRVAPADPRPHFGMARTLNLMGDFAGARRAVKEALRLRPDEPRYLCELANTEALLGRFDAALEAVESALSHEPNHGLALSGQFEFLRRLGRDDEAFARCAEAIEAGVTHPAVIAAFAELAPIRGQSDEAMEAVATCVRNQTTPPAMAAMLYNRLVIGLDRAGDSDLAFDAATRMNEALPTTFDADASDTWFAARTKTMTRDVIAALPRSTNPSANLVFIVGLPRSGTSLLEQILDCHPRITGIGEHAGAAGLIGALYDELTDGDDTTDNWRKLPVAAIDSAAGVYRQSVKALAPNADLIINKMPANALYLPEIASLFPDAKIIRCVRDLRDVCLSCYMTYFTVGHEFTRDLGTLARYAIAHRGMVDQFMGALADATLEVKYEQVVEDTEPTIRSVLDFLGVDWDDACLHHERSGRKIRTASHEQANRPIYRTSIGRWRRYERQLGPLLEALRDAGMTPDSASSA